MTKKIFIITGPQGSGNHLFSKIFSLHPDVNGWDINDGVYRPYRDEPHNIIWRDADAIDNFSWEGDYHVLSVSTPYVYKAELLVPNFNAAIRKFQDKGFDVHIGIIGRDKNIQDLQQKRLRGEGSTHMLLDLFPQLLSLPHTFLSFELASLYQVDYVKAIGKEMGLPVIEDSPLYKEIFSVNSNKRYVSQIEEGEYDSFIRENQRKGQKKHGKKDINASLEKYNKEETGKYTVYYLSGSAGFMVFYSLQMALGYDVSEETEAQWHIEENNKWKDSEVIDNRNGVLNDITISCNPFEIKKDSISILVYTDLETHETLSRLKKARWYLDDSTIHIQEDDVIKDFNERYINVKDSSWPDVKNFSDVENLPSEIKIELVEDFDFPENFSDPDCWRRPRIMTNYKTFRGLKVDPKLLRLVDEVDHIFLLQDIVNTKFRCVCDELGLDWTAEVVEHVTKWIELHPLDVQAFLHGDHL